MTRRRFAAALALVAGAATIVFAALDAVSEFPRGLGLLACVMVAGLTAWYAMLRRGRARLAGGSLNERSSDETQGPRLTALSGRRKRFGGGGWRRRLPERTRLFAFRNPQL